MAGKLLET